MITKCGCSKKKDLLSANPLQLNICYQEVTASIMIICNEELLNRNYGEVLRSHHYLELLYIIECLNVTIFKGIVHFFHFFLESTEGK